MVDIKSNAHPMDVSLMTKITDSSWYSSLVRTINDDSIDDICDRLIDCSYPQVPRDSNLYAYLEKGKDVFGVMNIRSLYETRDYSYEVSCHGYTNPILVIPRILLERNDEKIIEARILSGVASIAMGHHKLEFMLWMAENTLATMPVPLVSNVVREWLYQWYRSRKYTLDRAVWLATEDKTLTLRNILFGEVPFNVFDKMNFGAQTDVFLKQVRETKALSGISGRVSKFLGKFQAFDWLPVRYQYILDYIETKEK